MSVADPPEPTDEEIQEYHTAQNAKPGGGIRIEGLSREDVHATISGVLRGLYALDEKIDEAITAAVAKKVSEVAEDVIEQRVTAAIDDALACGFPEFDRYSGKIKRRTSLRELIDELLTLKVSEYGSRDLKNTLIVQAVERAVRAVIDKELEAEVAKARAAVKSQVDDVIKAKLGETLKSALGLR
jgi:flagellar biosynthesis/type III secretory pathway protein FliH